MKIHSGHNGKQWQNYSLSGIYSGKTLREMPLNLPTKDKETKRYATIFPYSTRLCSFSGNSGISTYSLAGKNKVLPKYRENAIKMIQRVGKVGSFATNATMTG